MLKNSNAVKLKIVDGAVFYIYGNYNDVPKLSVYFLLQQNNKIRKNRRKTVSDVVTSFTLLVWQTFLPKIYLSCSTFRLQTSLGRDLVLLCI